MLPNIIPAVNHSSPARQSINVTSSDLIEQKALEFAAADYRWQKLSADPQQWTVPEKQRTLAVAFLNYHAAKLALTADETD